MGCRGLPSGAGGTWSLPATGTCDRDNSIDLALPGYLPRALPFSVSIPLGPQVPYNVLKNTRWTMETSQHRETSRHPGPDILPRPVLTAGGDEASGPGVPIWRQGARIPYYVKLHGFKEMVYVAKLCEGHSPARKILGLENDGKREPVPSNGLVFPF